MRWCSTEVAGKKIGTSFLPYTFSMRFLITLAFATYTAER